MSIFNDFFHVKQSPILSMLGFGGGGTGNALGGAATAAFSASGGNVNGLAPGNGYKYHTFTSSGAFTLAGASGKTFEMLIVAGGGAGGSRDAPSGSDGGGGGGAGGLVHVPGAPLNDGTYAVTIGNGGTGVAITPTGPTPSGAQGGLTSFVLSGPSQHITATGGGGAGSGPNGGPMGPNGNGGSGGGGGGGGGSSPSYFGSAVVSSSTLLSAPQWNGYGTNGGSGDPASPHSGSGGGGAGSPGTNARNQPGSGPGGNGKQYPAFTGPLIGVPALNPLSGYYAGGGSGGSGGPGVNSGAGPAPGGGGASPGSNNNSSLTGSAGVTNSGAGGGGGTGRANSSDGGPSGTGQGGNGGPGILIIRYQP